MGSVSGTIAGQRNEYTISVDCDLGDSNLYDQRGTTDKILNAEVDMGSIDIRFVTAEKFLKSAIRNKKIPGRESRYFFIRYL